MFRKFLFFFLIAFTCPTLSLESYAATEINACTILLDSVQREHPELFPKIRDNLVSQIIFDQASGDVALSHAMVLLVVVQAKVDDFQTLIELALIHPHCAELTLTAAARAIRAHANWAEDPLALLNQICTHPKANDETLKATLQAIQDLSRMQPIALQGVADTKSKQVEMLQQIVLRRDLTANSLSKAAELAKTLTPFEGDAKLLLDLILHPSFTGERDQIHPILEIFATQSLSSPEETGSLLLEMIAHSKKSLSYASVPWYVVYLKQFKLSGGMLSELIRKIWAVPYLKPETLADPRLLEAVGDALENHRMTVDVATALVQEYDQKLAEQTTRLDETTKKERDIYGDGFAEQQVQMETNDSLKRTLEGRKRVVEFRQKFFVK